MQSKRWMMLRVLLNRFHGGNPDALLKCMSAEKAQEVMGCKTLVQDYSSAIALPLESIQAVHYTWLEPAFKKIPTTVHALILATLPEPQASKLSKVLGVAPFETPLADTIKGFFLGLFYDHFKDPAVLPVSFLPETPLRVLLNFTKEELVELIDLLGIYDLAEEIRQIIDKKKLQSLYLCLSEKKQQFLRICLHHRDKLSSPKLELNNWYGDPEKLESILHKRGLHRLGKALSGQHPDFFWHLAHKLDTGRGMLLQKYFTSVAIPGVTAMLIQQVMNVLNFLNKKSDA